MSLALAIAVLIPSAAARASTSMKACLSDGACGEVAPIDDRQMASIAGKFTIAGEVVGMNLLMNSSWQGANGQKLNGAAVVSLALPGAGIAGRFNTQASASGTEPAAADASTSTSTGIVSGSKGLNNVNGVSQAVQVAGDSNSVTNGAAVRVTTSSLNSYAGNGSTAATYQAANGAQAKVDIANNSVFLQLQTPNGIAQQSINDGSSGNIHQNIQVAANRQIVVNQLQLEVQIKPTTGLSLANQGFLQSVNALRGR